MSVTDTLKALARAQEQRDALAAQVGALREYVIYTPCPVCGLSDPMRKGANCSQCAKALAALSHPEQPA
jgi:hypothetical protein